ncbi:glycosyltransferase family 4 protein [Zhihengliuella sp. ISTPL4]|uniref:glycosyltransferase family 4 protein n=1 Tax=Zhihengliuella sp. ISTPL4 TaxID=2058657 RepID=UPI0013052319|nr:glycosyltransferase family 4 protein [Zhihengliuella sp. ISTPL4]
MNERTRVGVFAPFYPPAFRGGGPVRSISALVQAAPATFTPLVVTGDRDLGETEPLPVPANEWISHADADVYYASLSSPAAYTRALFALRRRRPGLLHLNSFMNPRLSIVPVLLWRLGFWGRARLLVSPRGEFGDGALSRRTGKKQAYMRLFRLLGLHRRVVWHSTAPHETADIRRAWGEPVTVVERENDTLLALAATEPSPLDGPLRAVFLGRIVEHKGLHIALSALQAVAAPVRLDVYGSREDAAYVRRCEALVRDLPPHISVTFHGPVAPEEVVSVLAQHELLLMPTAGENFGHVIAEALSASCAVAVTPLTPWTEVLSEAGGLVLDRAVEPWSRGIEERASSSREERLAARRHAGQTYERWRARPRAPHVWETASAVRGR